MALVKVTRSDVKKLREHEMVVFEGRIIQKARAPIDAATLDAVAARCSGPIPEGLVALWKSTFGGYLDYNLTANYEGTVAHTSDLELFYSGSAGYRDLWGWIEHELDIGDLDKLDYLPFAGFDYGSRVYVRVKKDAKYGQVVAWEKGLPPAWRMRLHEDSRATIGPDVASFFHALRLEDDPRAPTREFPAGSGLLEVIQGIGDPALETKLLALVDEARLDWRTALEAGPLADPRLARLALFDAVMADDVATLERLADREIDLEMQVTGGGTAVDVAFWQNKLEAARWLLDRNVAVPNALDNGATNLTVDFVRDLLERGAKATVRAALDVAETTRLDAALLIVKALAPADRSKVKAAALERATSTEASAERMTGDDATAYRARASSLRAFAKRKALGG